MKRARHNRQLVRVRAQLVDTQQQLARAEEAERDGRTYVSLASQRMEEADRAATGMWAMYIQQVATAARCALRAEMFYGEVGRQMLLDHIAALVPKKKKKPTSTRRKAR